MYHLEREHAAVRSLTDELPPLDLGLHAEDLLAQFNMFAALGAAELRALARLCRPRLLVPEEVVIHKGERGSAMFLIRDRPPIGRRARDLAGARVPH